MTADQMNTIYRSLEFRKTVSTLKNKRVAKVSKGKKKYLVTVADYLGLIPFAYMLPATKASEIFLFVPCRDDYGSSKMLNNNLDGV